MYAFILHPLQTQRFRGLNPGTNSESLIYFGIFLAAAFVALIIFNIINNRKNARGAGYSRWGLRRMAKRAGLDSGQIKLFEQMVKVYKISDPTILLQNHTRFERVLRRVVGDIEESDVSDGEKEKRKHLMFSINQQIETFKPGKSKGFETTRHLRVGQTIQVTAAGKYTYSTKVTTNMKDMFGTDLPSDIALSEDLFRKGEILTINFNKGEQETYKGKVKVWGYETILDATSLFMSHNDKMVLAHNRKLKRKEADMSAYFFPVNIINIGSGKHARKEAVVNKNNKSYGIIQDLSSGGCAIKTTYPLVRGTLIRIDFEPSYRNMASVFGKVKNVSTSAGKGGIMHIQFTSVSRKNLNKIRSYVYGIFND